MKIFNLRLIIASITLFLLSACGKMPWDGIIWDGTTKLIVSFYALIGAWYLFWPTITILILIISRCIDDSDPHPFAAIFSLSIFIFIIQATQNIEIFNFIKENIFLSLIYIFTYIIMGIIWSHAKLRFYGKERKARFNEIKERFLKDYNNDINAWIEHLRKQGYNKSDFDLVEPKIKTWFIYWPFSMFWFFTHDIINRLFRSIYSLLKNSYRKVYNSAISDILADYEKVKAINNQHLESKNATSYQKNENEDEDND